ncbi:histidine kinase [uncultured Alistipes sp.]|jgi:hypothetical protein|uniref:sensor histidine kinase n=1 Tax=uncultured Alistipes sp. TaxID=538949 RepID=UPI0026321375|nr:histidine kinase [uncultured Alistipes sp.]
MARFPIRTSLVAHLLVALAISLVVNFSYLLLLFVDRKSEPQPVNERAIDMPHEGRLRIAPDGYGYLLYAADGAPDSVYVSPQRVRRLRLADGDRLEVTLNLPRTPRGHYSMAEVRRRNGEEFDYRTVFNRPSEAVETVWQLCFYFVMAFVLLTILGPGRRTLPTRRFALRCAWCVAAASALYLLAPTIDWHTGRIVMNFRSHAPHFDFVLVLKCSFTLVVAILYGWIARLSSQRQDMEIENERLKNENLMTRYNMLVNQVNPHFFFNSLNSLAMLVRGQEPDKALNYIDQLSYTFRYVLQSGRQTLVPLDEELRFAEAYAYLFRIRYADKLFFDIAIDEAQRDRLLPALTLQPLIDNAVKHNTITRSKPFRISIRTEGDWLVVSNRKAPKLQPEPGTGIGLENLRRRWMLLTGHPIAVTETESEFTVRMPLQKTRKP